MRLPILTYHSLDTSGSPVSVSPAALRRHLVRLHDEGYTVLPVGEALARLTHPEPRPWHPKRPPRLVALTFDDGYASVHEHAWPLLADYGWRATVFPISQNVGGLNSWPGQLPSIPTANLAGWRQLRELKGAGWEIGAHSQTHADLTALDDRALLGEVRNGRAELEDRLGGAVQLFAYPYGRYDLRVRAAVRATYEAACTTVMRAAGTGSDPYALERIDMWYFARRPFSDLVASTWMTPFVASCRAARAVRAARRHQVTPSLVPHSAGR